MAGNEGRPAAKTTRGEGVLEKSKGLLGTIKAFIVVIAIGIIIYLFMPSFHDHGIFIVLNNTTNTTLIAMTRKTAFMPTIIKPLEGASLFAVIYIIAQLIERIVEPLSKISNFGDSDSIDEGKIEIDKWKEIIKKSLENEATADDAHKDAAVTATNIARNSLKTKMSENSNEESQRVTRLWALSSVLGFIFCYFLIGLFELTGLPLNGLWLGRFWDALFSGVILGGGTKSVHDLIDYVQTKGK